MTVCRSGWLSAFLDFDPSSGAVQVSVSRQSTNQIAALSSVQLFCNVHWRITVAMGTDVHDEASRDQCVWCCHGNTTVRCCVCE